MDNHQNNNQGAVQNNEHDQHSDLFRNVPIRSEQTQSRSGTVPNNEEIVPNETQNRSEHVPNSSEQEQNEPVETFRTAPVCSVEHKEHYTITVREAARIFEEAGVPRTERAITKWCNQNARGITRLACCYDEPERKYYITPASIETAITEERRKFQYTEYQNGEFFSDAAENLSEHVRNERDNRSERPEHTKENVPNSSEHVPNEKHIRSEQVQNGSEQRSETVRNEARSEHDTDNAKDREADTSREEAERLRDIKMENFNLRVQVEGQTYLLKKYDELLQDERTRHEQEKIALVDRLTDARHQIGALEERLLQIEAPKRTVRDAEVDRGVDEERTRQSDPAETVVHYAPSRS